MTTKTNGGRRNGGRKGAGAALARAARAERTKTKAGVARVSERVMKYLSASRSANTVKSYAADLKDFFGWGGRVPAKPERVAEYLAELAETLAYATIKRRTAALTLAHHERNFPSPCHAELVRSTLRGIRRRKPGAPKRMRPMLAEQVMAAVKGERGIKGARDRALMMLGFAGAFRRSELVALNVEDLGMRGAQMVVTIRSSKTDQEARGRVVVVPKGSRKSRCAVEATVAWLETAGIAAGAVFRPINRHGTVLEKRLSAGSVGVVVKRSAAKLGLDPRHYGGHSLRAGYVTTAALKGVPLWRVREQTGHSRETMVECYIRVPGDGTQRRRAML